MRSDVLSKIILPEEKLPKFWYNVQADMPNLPAPALNPVTKTFDSEDLLPIFPIGVLEQEVSKNAIEILAE